MHFPLSNFLDLALYSTNTWHLFEIIYGIYQRKVAFKAEESCTELQKYMSINT